MPSSGSWPPAACARSSPGWSASRASASRRASGAAVQAGEVEIEEYSEHTLICAAAGGDLPGAVHADAGGPRHRHAGAAPRHRRAVEPTRASGRALRRLHAARRSTSPSSTCTRRDVRGNVRVDPKLVWMDSELVKAAATTIVTVERIVARASFRRAPAPHDLPRASRSTPWSRRRGAPTPPRCFPRYAYDGDFFRGYAAAPRPGSRRPSGASGSWPRDATPPSSTPTAARAPCSRSPGGRREQRRTRIDELMVAALARGVHERHARLQRRGLVRPRLRLPARPGDPRSGPGVGGQLDRDRRRPDAIPESTLSDAPLGRRHDARQLGRRLLVVRPEPAATTPSPSAAPRSTRYGNVNNTVIGPYARRRCACPAAAAWPTSACMIPRDLPVVDDPRPAYVRRAARLPLGHRLGRRRRPPRAPRAARRAAALRHQPLRVRLPRTSPSGCGFAACTRASRAEQVIEATGFAACRRPRATCPRDRRADRRGAADPARGGRPDRGPPAGVPVSQTAAYPDPRRRSARPT